MNFVGIIPARFGSTRLEGKPLLDILGKPMIQRVYERASQVMDHLYVATDDERIEAAVKGFGGKVVMTSSSHQTGTNRCVEALKIINESTGENFDAVINIQGDEPLLEPSQLTELMKCFNEANTNFSTLVTPLNRIDDLFNESEVFVTFNKNRDAMYFSRSVIPHLRGVDKSKWLEKTTIYKHLGLYAYTAETLAEFSQMEMSSLEKLESLEQLRWLENGGKIKVGITEHDTIPVDTIDDLERVRDIYEKLNL